MIKEIPILFSTPMVQSILERRKTQTRRIIKTADINNAPDQFRYIGNSTEMEIPRKAIPYDDRIYYKFQLGNSNAMDWVDTCPYGKPGDILWVRETSRGYWEGKTPGICSYVDEYKTGGKRIRKSTFLDLYTNKNPLTWTPSIHMPKAAARIWLKVVSIRIERIKDISQEDSHAEGIFPAPHRPSSEGCTAHSDRSLIKDCFKCAFKVLWNKINGESGYGWEVNPWVWVVEFKIIDKP